jgi:hypothetical protein
LINGSSPNNASLSTEQAKNLAAFVKVWGFLKYYHPDARGGLRNWDSEFLELIPTILDAESREDAELSLWHWVNTLSHLPGCAATCASTPPDMVLYPGLDWLSNGELGPNLSESLNYIYENRQLSKNSHYVRQAAPGASHAVFSNELSYEQFTLPDLGFRILAVARFWNIVDYWYPYRDLLSLDWDAVLVDSIKQLPEIATESGYHRFLTRLISLLEDSHAKWRVDASLPHSGDCILPTPLRFIDDQLVVTSITKEAQVHTPRLRVGDIILSVDGESVADIVTATSQFYPASNIRAKRRDLAIGIARGTCGEMELDIHRGDRAVSFSAQRISFSEIDSEQFRHDRYGDAFQWLSDRIAYIKISEAKAAEIPTYIQRSQSADGLIIDMRGYPRERLRYELGGHFVREPTEFAKFSVPDFQNPGGFVWQSIRPVVPIDPYLDKPLALLIDETTQSSAEFITMAFRIAPRAMVIGVGTAGADGNFSGFSLPGGVQGGITGIGVFYPDGRPTQRVGIVPDCLITPSLAGVKRRVDEILEMGVRFIESVEEGDRSWLKQNCE